MVCGPASVIHDFNPRSPCGERLCHAPTDGSNHAQFQPTLPVRGATPDGLSVCQRALISTHAPRAGSDPRSFSPPSFLMVFQPTLPVRGATGGITKWHSRLTNFNPRSPCGERQHRHRQKQHHQRFQPTLPVRGATEIRVKARFTLIDFNPRSPCGERPDCLLASLGQDNFNPRSPCGERHYPLIIGV